MKYAVQEYTSAMDGKVRFRMVSLNMRETIFKDWQGTNLGFMIGHFHGPEDGWNRERAKMEADNLRLERRLG